jgi:hypothetical protein
MWCVMKPKPYVLVTAAIFTVVALLHLIRLIFGWSIVVAGWHVPLWFSWLAIVVLAVLISYAVRLSGRLH